jgi:signal transduction histidine kinase
VVVETFINELEPGDGTPPALRSVTQLAAVVARTPMATVNLLTEASQYQVATVGFDASVCRREDSMCRHTVEEGRPIVLGDAREDDRFRDNPFVTGDIGHVRFYASFPLETSSGETLGSLCVFDTEPREIDESQVSHLQTLAHRVVDILELALNAHELERALADVSRLSEELRRSNDHLAAFAGEVSHDLSNPLSTAHLAFDVLGSQVLASLPERNEVGERWVATGTDATTLMRGMIDDFLDFAKVGGAAVREPVPLDEAVAVAQDRLKVQLDGRRLEARPLPTVLGNAGQLAAVLQNLLSNAVKFSDDPVDVLVEATPEGGLWRVAVSDRGRGLGDVAPHTLFEPLERGPEHGVDGTGIGLSLCRRIVQAHGGTIGLEPRAGGGTTAWFTVPGVPD